MATEVQESTGSIRSEKELRDYERKLYALLRYVVRLHKDLLKAHGIDHRIFHYYFRGGGPAWSRKKEELAEKLLEIIETDYPALHEVREELEKYLSAIRKFRNRR